MAKRWVDDGEVMGGDGKLMRSDGKVMGLIGN
jgi:hypothetical protein